MQELSVIQKTYDLVKWLVPILNRLPRSHKFVLGDRLMNCLYELLDGLILARYSRDRVNRLNMMNGRLDVLRHQMRLLLDFKLIKPETYRHSAVLINEIGLEIGGWLRQQKTK